MKKAILFMALCLMAGTTASYAQLTKEQIKERKEIRKLSKKELSEKASKQARKEAKKLTKDGWTITPGALPIDKQLDKSYLMQQEFDEDMFPKYIMAEAMSIGENYDAAKMQAQELAKQNLAGQIQTEVTALGENMVANKQLEAEEAASIAQSLATGKNLITQSIGRVIPVVETYRTKGNKNKEVLVRIAYNAKMAKAAAKAAIREDLEKMGKEQMEKLNEHIGW